MSVRLEITWEGLDNLIRFLERDFPEAVAQSSIIALDKTADDARDRAKQNVAVDTGALRKSIRKERFARPTGNIFYSGVRAGGYVRNPRTGRIVDYAGFVEYGTSGQRPRPYLRPAIKWAMMHKFPYYFWSAMSRRVKLD